MNKIAPPTKSNKTNIGPNNSNPSNTGKPDKAIRAAPGSNTDKANKAFEKFKQSLDTATVEAIS
jgi:hypothetical protein